MKFPKEIKGYEEKINRMARLKTELGNKDLDKRIDDLKVHLQKEFEEIASLSKGKRENEANSYKDILAHSVSPRMTYKVKNYTNKLKGAIYGRFAGCALGAPVELLSLDELEYFAKDIGMSYPPKYYWTKAPNGYFPRYKVGKGNHFTTEEMTFLSTDDDIAYTFLSLIIMEKHGVNFTTEDVAKEWMEYLPIDCTFTAERVALQNLKDGISPLKAGDHNNPDTEFIGASIRCDGYAYVNPGNPLLASKLAYKDAYLSHRRSGIYSSMYFAAVISLAFSESSLEKALEKGLDFIPSNTEFYKQIKWALNNFENISDYKDANQQILDRFPGMSWVHAINNAILTVWGVLFGKKGFDKGITTTVAFGFDNDCTAATVGSILGAFYGIDEINSKWYTPWNDTALSYLNGIDKFSLTDVIERFNKLNNQ